MSFGEQGSGFQNPLIPLFEAGNRIIIDKHGLVVYNGTPAANNVIASLAPFNFTDRFGNNILFGITSYDNQGYASQILANGIAVNINSALPNQSGTWSVVFQVESHEAVAAAYAFLFNGAHPIVIGAANSAPVTTAILELQGNATEALAKLIDAGGGSIDIDPSTTLTDHIGATLIATTTSTGIRYPVSSTHPNVGIDDAGHLQLVNASGAQLTAQAATAQASLNVSDDDGITYDTERRTIILTADLTTSATIATGIFGVNPTLVSGRKYRVRVWLSIVSAGATGSYTFALAGGAVTAPPTRTGFGVRQAAVTAQNSTAGLASGGSASSSTIGWVEFHGTIQPSANAAYNVTVLVTSGASAITIHAGSFMEFEPISL